MIKSFKQFINEKKKSEKKKVVVYSGRFQPFHKNHFDTYKFLVDKFGEDNVFIGTSDKTDDKKSPFKFKEKHKIITSMFPIPKDKVLQIKSPYGPKEILSKFPEDSIFVSAVGEKDADRLTKGKYFEDYSEKASEGYRDKGYVFIVPLQRAEFEGELVSGTSVRTVMSGEDEEKKEKLFQFLYNKMNKTVFNLLKKGMERLS